MDPIIAEWLNLVLRWLHIVTGIAWIGTSFFFMWLDSHIEPPAEPKGKVEGELWLTHSGGFYQIAKMDLAPAEIPKTLHWFKWEAGFTWISGFLLLAVIYYLGAEVYLIDPQVADIPAGTAIGLSLAILLAGWLIYDRLYRSPLRHAGLLVEAIGCGLLAALSYGLTLVYSDRGAYVHVGAMLGTIMAANVWFIIIPGQRKLVEATKAGAPLDPRLAFDAKQRSVHNNYMTLPVIFIMMSSHYPSTFGHDYGWAILLALFAVGAVVRHWFNLKNAGRIAYWPFPTAAAILLAVIWLATPPTFLAGAAPATDDREPVTFAEAYAVIAERCVSCHAAKPANEDFDAPPKNVMFDTAEQIQRQAIKIRAVSVLTRTMPLGDDAGMTDAERALLGRWIDEGANIE